MIRVVPIVAAILLAGLAASATSARAEDDVPAEQRMQAEHLFADGLVHHVPDALRGADSAQGRLPVELDEPTAAELEAAVEVGDS